MSATPRQGSASFTIVIAVIAAIGTGAFLLTFIVYPIYNGFTSSAFWAADTVPGSRVVTFVSGLWEFWGGIILLALVSFVWIRTRQ
jgi:hypothetical protein